MGFRLAPKPRFQQRGELCLVLYAVSHSLDRISRDFRIGEHAQRESRIYELGRVGLGDMGFHSMEALGVCVFRLDEVCDILTFGAAFGGKEDEGVSIEEVQELGVQTDSVGGIVDRALSRISAVQPHLVAKEPEPLLRRNEVCVFPRLTWQYNT